MSQEGITGTFFTPLTNSKLCLIKIRLRHMNWSQYEDKINYYLNNRWEKLLQLLLTIYRKCKIQLKRKSKELMSINLSQVKEDLLEFTPFAIEKFHHYKEKIPKKILSNFKDLKRDKRWIKSTAALASFFIFGYLSTLQLLNIFHQFQEPKRSIASIKSEESHRPPYYNDEKKQVTIYNINIPILVDKNRLTKSIIVDFTVQLSSRHSKLVLESLHHELNDYINTNTAPIVKYFPLTVEGKGIVKNKLINSLQILLNKKDIKANIKDIFIISILSS